MIFRKLISALSLTGLTALPALAHPHSYVEQQVQLSIGCDMVSLTAEIIPSTTNGAAIFSQIDLDKDGELSSSEAEALGAAIMSTMTLEMDGEMVSFAKPAVSVSNKELISAGSGGIQIETAAMADVCQANTLGFDVTYDAIAHGWFVQPFYFSDLMEKMGVPELVRSDDTDAIRLVFGAS